MSQACVQQAYVRLWHYCIKSIIKSIVKSLLEKRRVDKKGTKQRVCLSPIIFEYRFKSITSMLSGAYWFAFAGRGLLGLHFIDRIFKRMFLQRKPLKVFVPLERHFTFVSRSLLNGDCLSAIRSLVVGVFHKQLNAWIVRNI